MEPTASSEDPEIVADSLIARRRQAAALAACMLGCLGDCRAEDCTQWRNFLPATPQAQLEAVSLRAGRPVALGDFDVVAGPKPDHVLIRSPGDLNDPQLTAGLRSSFDQTAAAYRRDGALVVGRVEFGPQEPCVEAPRPPALPEHPAIDITMALRRASAMGRQRRIAAQLIVDLGVSDEVIEAASARLMAGCGAIPQMTPEMHVRAVFDAVLAEILA